MKAQAYAKVLFDLRTTEQPDQVFARFLTAIRERGHESLLPAITQEFERLLSQQHTAQTVVLVDNHDDLEKQKATIQQALTELALDPEQITTTVDTSLIGGFRIETSDRLYDASYKQALINLYQQLVA